MLSHTIGRDAGSGCPFDPSASIASEINELRTHAQRCQHSRDLVFWTQYGLEKVLPYVGGRIITLVVLATLILLVAGLVCGG